MEMGTNVDAVPGPFEADRTVKVSGFLVQTHSRSVESKSVPQCPWINYHFHKLLSSTFVICIRAWAAEGLLLCKHQCYLALINQIDFEVCKLTAVHILGQTKQQHNKLSAFTPNTCGNDSSLRKSRGKAADYANMSKSFSKAGRSIPNLIDATIHCSHKRKGINEIALSL